jgi:hypothetical protein
VIIGALLEMEVGPYGSIRTASGRSGGDHLTY